MSYGMKKKKADQQCQVPNITTCPSTPGARELIFIAILLFLGKKKKE
jgi:hypothetical protein